MTYLIERQIFIGIRNGSYNTGKPEIRIISNLNLSRIFNCRAEFLSSFESSVNIDPDMYSQCARVGRLVENKVFSYVSENLAVTNGELSMLWP